MKHDELVKKLRSGCDANTAFLLCYEAADAIVALREEREALRALLAEAHSAAVHVRVMSKELRERIEVVLAGKEQK